MVDGYNGSEKTIFIVDRGYESYNNLAHVIEKGAFFLFRCKDINSNGIVAFSKDKLPNKDEFDTNISLILTRKWTKEILNNRDKYRHFRNNDTFDYLDLTEHIFYHMNLRVLRFKISEEDYECILTNLSQNEFSANEIKKLYAMRWGIETSFRELKYAVGLTSFHAKKREYIIQEIWSRLILYNFCEIITSHVTIGVFYFMWSSVKKKKQIRVVEWDCISYNKAVISWQPKSVSQDNKSIKYKR